MLGHPLECCLSIASSKHLFKINKGCKCLNWGIIIRYLALTLAFTVRIVSYITGSISQLIATYDSQSQYASCKISYHTCRVIENVIV